MARPTGVSADKDFRAQIVDLRLNGATLQDISNTLGVALATAHRICQKEGVKKPKGRIEQNLSKILELTERGHYLSEIAKMLQIRYNSLYLYLKERDYPINYQRRRA